MIGASTMSKTTDTRPADTFAAYTAASRLAWLTYIEYREGRASERDVAIAGADEAKLKEAHTAALTDLEATR
jgi:hypothetical protein